MQTFIVKTLFGLEPVLSAEIEALGGTNIRPLKRAVSFEGDQRLLYRANYELRTALRIFMPVHSFVTSNERNFYTKMRDFDWTELMGVTDTLAIDAIAAGEYFRHAKHMSLVAKDAIVDQFRDRFSRRPDVNTVSPTLRIHLRINGAQCDLLLDASGESLHKRGYRRDGLEAPLNEVLAAGMLLQTGWTGDTPFVDPMCGSGTLAIEAALLATHKPPQYSREAFGFQRWRDFDAKLWKTVRAEADAAARPLPAPIFAFDKDAHARNTTAVNLMGGELTDLVKVEKMAFEKLEPPAENGLMVTNPPYDERLQVSEAIEFYQAIGDRLKQRWAGWDAWIISSNLEALKHLGLRPSRRIPLMNGALECSFQKFSMYEGKKHGGEEV